MDILKLRDELKKKSLIYSDDPLRVDEYLSIVWDLFNSFFRHHRENALVAETHRECQFFICRTFTIATVFHSAFGYVPSRRDLLVTAINLLGDDLTEKELELFTYLDDVINSGRGMYASGVVAFYIRMVALYRERDFPHDLAPPSPWHAFPLLALNRPEFTSGKIRLSDSILCDALIDSHTNFDQAVRALIEKK